MRDFDQPDDGFDEFELSDEDIASIKRSIQDANDGFTYEMLFDDNESLACKCNKCGRIGNMLEKPFPHRFDCLMKLRVKD